MTFTAKISTIIFAISLCIGGAILSAKDETDKPAKSKPTVIPIRHQTSQDTNWLRA